MTAFGLFDWVDHSGAPVNQLFRQRLQLLEAAEAAGFFCYHLAEHHMTPLGQAPSPALFLTAAAQHTSRMRLGPLVYLLPLYHPLRLIEEICILDQLSDGRLELGVGRGVSPYELRYFGVDPEASRAIFHETLAAMLAGFTRERLSFAGQHVQCDDVPMTVHPLQKPYPPLWYPTHNPESVEYAARQGLNFVGLGPAAAVGHHVDAYRKTWTAHQHDAGRLNAHVSAPKLGVLRQVVVADTDAAAQAAASAAHATWYRSILQLWHEHNDHSVDGLFAWDGAVQAETILFGSPARLRDQIARLLQESRCNYVICCFAFGSLPHAVAMHSLRLFAEEVMPAFAA